MMALSCCRNCSAADDGCAFGRRHLPLLDRGKCAGAASWPTPLVHGVRQLFGAGLIKLEENILQKSATLPPSIPAVLPNSISQPARGQVIMILPTAHRKTVSRCDSTACKPRIRATTT